MALESASRIRTLPRPHPEPCGPRGFLSLRSPPHPTCRLATRPSQQRVLPPRLSLPWPGQSGSPASLRLQEPTALPVSEQRPRPPPQSTHGRGASPLGVIKSTPRAPSPHPCPTTPCALEGPVGRGGASGTSDSRVDRTRESCCRGHGGTQGHQGASRSPRRVPAQVDGPPLPLPPAAGRSGCMWPGWVKCKAARQHPGAGAGPHCTALLRGTACRKQAKGSCLGGCRGPASPRSRRGHGLQTDAKPRDPQRVGRRDNHTRSRPQPRPPLPIPPHTSSALGRPEARALCWEPPPPVREAPRELPSGPSAERRAEGLNEDQTVPKGGRDGKGNGTEHRGGRGGSRGRAGALGPGLQGRGAELQRASPLLSSFIPASLATGQRSGSSSHQPSLRPQKARDTTAVPGMEGPVTAAGRTGPSPRGGQGPLAGGASPTPAPSAEGGRPGSRGWPASRSPSAQPPALVQLSPCALLCKGPPRASANDQDPGGKASG